MNTYAEGVLFLVPDTHLEQHGEYRMLLPSLAIVVD
ncbi:MAG: hypothetical protein K0Q79_2120 [Flavipsychrobacter sp.]|jgi:hypothetical protein|nr:hypothetical protein [Flavipsychrobacter sp.]